jgi:uncharacterized FAD-dependent dehydrogenase
MAKKIKRKYCRNFCVGLRIEVPNKFVHNKDLLKVYGKDHSIYLVDLCHGGKVVAKKADDLLLAKNDGSGTSVSNFSVLVNFGDDLEEVRRIIKIMNVLGDDKLFKERVQTFVTGKSLLNAIPELLILKQALTKLEQFIPRFCEIAWFSAPDAKLR